MKPLWKNLIAVLIFVVFAVAGFVIASLIHLKSPSYWILVGVFAALGLIGAGAWLWWKHSQPSEVSQADAAAGSLAPEQEIDFLFRQAESRLRSSRLGRGARIGKMPLILLAGETGSGKTSVALQSGIEFELLAGQVSDDARTAPTHSVNIWYTSAAVLAEAAGGLLNQPASWARLIRRSAPRGVASIFGRKGPAGRAAVVCVSLETFLRPGSAEPGAAARSLRSNLEDASRRLGISLPLYVLFTKADQVPFFAEYAENFLPDEAAQVFGATLPIVPNLGSGLFAEQETKRLSAAFDELFYGLSDGRLNVLPREHSAERLPGAYEFPREFRKLRSGVVQFLVELCRPSQLTASPFLRGFYFAGKRTVLVETAQAEETTQRRAAAPAEEDMGATRVISAAQIQRIAAAQRQTPGLGGTQVFDLRGMAAGGGHTKSVEQPVFLGRLFSDIFLRDRAGLAASGSSSKVSFWRRFLLAAAAVVCVVFSIGFIVSFLGNRALKQSVDQSVAAIQAANPGNTPLATQLQQLDALRQPLVQIGNYNINGEPWRLGWWLYPGHSLYPKACSAYANEFRGALLGPAQASLVASLRGLPSAPTGDYGTAYDQLRAYLITTSNPEESQQAFLTPELYDAWAAGRDMTPAEEKLARAQFDFYADALQNEKALNAGACFASAPDADAVAHARAYLNQFPPEERVYRAMLADASKNSAPVIYGRAYPNSAGVVSDPVEIAGAYTKDGWAQMQKDLDNPQPFMKGEPWVLGSQVNGTVDVITLQQHLRQRYLSEFAGAWRNFLSSARVAPYANLGDASRKLGDLTGNTSPLLELFWLVSHNVSANPDALKEFQPVAKVVPPSDQQQYVSPANQNYLGGLLNLKTAVDQLAQQPQAALAPGGGANPVAGAAAQATTTTAQIAQAFTPDPVGHVDSMTQRLLLEPITNVQSAMPKPGEALNGQGRAFCAQFRPLFGESPFSANPRAPAAAPAQFTALFQPGGALSTFYTQTLATALTFTGTGYSANPGSPVKISPLFLAFFNRAMGVQRAFYPNGGGQPQLRFALSPLPPQGVKQFSITIDGQTMSYPGGAVQIVWSPLTAASTKKMVDGGSVDYPGPWGVFSMFREAQWKTNGNGYDLTWVQKSGDQILRLPNGQPETSGVHLDMMGAPPIFEPGYFSTLSCVSRVAE